MAARRGLFFLIQIMGTLLSRLSGLIRLQVQGVVLGAGEWNDLFLFSQQLPMLLRSLLGEEPLKQAFLPQLKHHQVSTENGEGATQVSFPRRFLGWYLRLLAVGLIGVSLGLPLVTWLMAPGLTPESRWTVAWLSLLAFPGLVFIGLSGYVMVFLYTEESSRGHWVTSLCPIAFNGGMALCGLMGLLDPDRALTWFAIGFSVGGLGQFLLQLPFWQQRTERGRSLLVPEFRGDTPHLDRVRHQWWPSVYGSALLQINITVDRMIGSYLTAGSVTALSYASRVFQLPIGAIGVSTSVALHSTMARQFAQGDRQGLRHGFRWGVLNIVFLVVPMMVVFLVAAEPLSLLLFAYGRFSPEGARRTALALQLYSIALVPYCLNQFLRMCFSAIEEVHTRIRIDTVTVALNAALSVVLAWAAPQIGLPGFAGLALGTALASTIQIGWYIVGYARDVGFAEEPGFTRGLLTEAGRMAAAGALAGALAWAAALGLSGLLGGWTESSGRVGLAVELVVQCSIAGGGYLVLCHLLGVSGPRQLVEKLLRRVRKI